MKLGYLERELPNLGFVRVKGGYESLYQNGHGPVVEIQHTNRGYEVLLRRDQGGNAVEHRAQYDPEGNTLGDPLTGHMVRVELVRRGIRFF